MSRSRILIVALAAILCLGAIAWAGRPSRREDPLAGVRAQIAALKADPSLLPDCHPRMHEIGEAAYAKFGLKAMEVGDEWCNAGYFHGVIEMALADAKDPIATMRTLCDPFPPGSFTGWECRHGTGHGLMYYTDEDLPRALALCGNSPDGADACRNGAYMENFVADGVIHKASWRRDDDSFFPCDAPDAVSPGDCYLYAPAWWLKRHGSDYSGALAWCETAGDFASACVRGVGAQAMKDHVDDPDGIVSVCVSAQGDRRDDCVAGLTSAHALHDAGLDATRAWCERLSGTDLATCRMEIASMRALFSR